MSIRKTHTEKFKQEVVGYSVEHGAAAAADKFKLRRGAVYAWRRKAGAQSSRASSVDAPMDKSIAIKQAVTYLRHATRSDAGKKAEHYVALALLTLEEIA